MAETDLDLAEMRRHLMRLGAVQSGLLVGIVLLALLMDGLNAWLLAWMALLPVGVAAWSALYYRMLAGAAGGDRRRLMAVNKQALGLLGGIGLAWAVGLGVVWVIT